MRKLIILIIVFFNLNLFSINEGYIKYNNTVVECQGNNCKFDTLYINNHPNSSDSLVVTKIVHGVASTISVKNPILKGLLQNEWILSSFVAFILFIWRRIEMRRMRRKGILIDKAFK
jgi:hypothetical protein